VLNFVRVKISVINDTIIGKYQEEVGAVCVIVPSPLFPY